jgi:N-acetylglucosamine kinase-like BadF-type ATPase
MKISDLISLTENKLATLNQAISTAIARGDEASIAKLDAEVLETQASLDQLKTLE